MMFSTNEWVFVGFNGARGGALEAQATLISNAVHVSFLN